MPLIIVLDGCDVTGKTTLAAALMQLVPGSVYRHLTYRWHNKMPLYHLAAINLAVRSSAPLVILDRWWPSEAVYAKVYRGGSKWPTMGLIFDRMAIREGVVMCITRRADRKIQMEAHAESHRKREEMYAPDEKIGELHEKYQKLVHHYRHRPDWVSYNLDTSGGDVMHFAEHLLRVAKVLKYWQILPTSKYVNGS